MGIDWKKQRNKSKTTQCIEYTARSLFRPNRYDNNKSKAVAMMAGHVY